MWCWFWQWCDWLRNFWSRKKINETCCYLLTRKQPMVSLFSSIDLWSSVCWQAPGPAPHMFGSQPWRTWVPDQKQGQQDCIPVWCVPTAYWPYSWVPAWEGARGGDLPSWRGSRQTPSPLWTDRCLWKRSLLPYTMRSVTKITIHRKRISRCCTWLKHWAEYWSENESDVASDGFIDNAIYCLSSNASDKDRRKLTLSGMVDLPGWRQCPPVHSLVPPTADSHPHCWQCTCWRHIDTGCPPPPEGVALSPVPDMSAHPLFWTWTKNLHFIPMQQFLSF